MSNGSILKRPEIVTLLTAIVVTVLVPLAAKSGVGVPENAVALTIAAFWGLFVTSVYEGWKKPDYQGGVKTLVGFKAVAAYGAVLLVLAQGGLKALSIELPEAVVTDLVGLLLALMGLKANSDRSAGVG